METPSFNLKIPAILDRYFRKKDHSVSLTFVTSLEVSKKEREEIDQAWQQEGWLIFVPNDTPEISLPTERAIVGEKSPSEILRNRMFVYWKEKGIDTPFDIWRRSQLDAIGHQYLNNIPPASKI